MWLKSLSPVLIAGILCACVAEQQVLSGKWAECVRAENGRPVLNTSLFAKDNEFRYTIGDVVKYSLLPSVTNSSWQSMSRLASNSGVRWIFVQSLEDADILVFSARQIEEAGIDAVSNTLRDFVGAGTTLDDYENSLLDRLRTLPDMFIFQRQDRPLAAKIVLYHDKGGWPPQGMTAAVASAMTVGNASDFEVLRKCRENGVEAVPLSYSPTDEDRAVFNGMLRLN